MEKEDGSKPRESRNRESNVNPMENNPMDIDHLLCEPGIGSLVKVMG